MVKVFFFLPACSTVRFLAQSCSINFKISQPHTQKISWSLCSSQARSLMANYLTEVHTPLMTTISNDRSQTETHTWGTGKIWKKSIQQEEEKNCIILLLRPFWWNFCEMWEIFSFHFGFVVCCKRATISKYNTAKKSGMERAWEKESERKKRRQRNRIFFCELDECEKSSTLLHWTKERRARAHGRRRRSE